MGSALGGLDRRRLRLGLLAFFLALAVPSGLLVYQAFGRLEWEGFHQQQVLAEALAQRVDAHLAALLDDESARSFADYAFLIVEGDPRAGYLQRSPLSTYPPRPEIPGLIGYFQVDAQGAFSSPLLPRGSIDPRVYGLTPAEVAERTAAEQHLEQILSSNRLAERRRAEGGGRDATKPTFNADERASVWSSARETLDLPWAESGSRAETDSQLAAAAPAQQGAKQEAAPVGPPNLAPPPRAMAQAGAPLTFERLNETQGSQAEPKAGARADAVGAEQEVRPKAANPEAKSQAFEPTRRQRQSRREVGVLPDPEAESSPVTAAGAAASLAPQSQRNRAKASPPASPAESTDLGSNAKDKDAMEPAANQDGKTPTAAVQRPPIRTFESEIDPFEASRLAGGQLVLYRKVWRDGQRYTQGALIDPEPFLRGLIGGPFREAALNGTSDLEVTWRGERLALFIGQYGRDYASQALHGTPLYQTRLSAPLSDLELAFSVTRLPLGPGAEVVTWVATALVLVLCTGMLGLYRLGVRQIGLVRQQQDFVSAVTHELKTPLTSIRMYSEMLREGWVPKDKRPDYYRFIHDESERLSRLINNVLQLARMTRNEQRLELRPIACTELMDQAQSKVSSRIDGAGFTLHLAYPTDAEETILRADPDAFAQILINLVDNAVKFAAKADVKVVDISCEPTRRGGAQFRVRDYGPGVPRDQIKKVFRLFYRAEGALTRETLGTGIGLALVQSLTRAMGGTVDLVNRDPGVEVRLTLPAAGSDAATGRAPPSPSDPF